MKKQLQDFIPTEPTSATGAAHTLLDHSAVGRVVPVYLLPMRPVSEAQLFSSLRNADRAVVVLAAGDRDVAEALMHRSGRTWSLAEVADRGLAGTAPGQEALVSDAFAALEKRLSVREFAYVDAAGGTALLATDGRQVVGVFLASKGILMYPKGRPMDFPEADVVYRWADLSGFLWEPARKP